MKINKYLSCIVVFTIYLVSCVGCQELKFDVDNFELERVVSYANKYLTEDPITITAFISGRSMGGKNDFYSEGDYWWPNPEDSEGPYIRKDGFSNPDNFVEHRVAMRNMSIKVACLTAAYKLTGDKKYAEASFKHLDAWFINKETRMNPNLLFAQAIKGVVSGRGIGIIDSIHLIEVAKAIEVLNASGFLKLEDSQGLLNWFKEYTLWLTTHQYGIDERDHGNNHSAWWVAQVAAFSDLTDNEENLTFCRKLYKDVILPKQMDSEGRFTDELTRTKPYAYSMFNLEAFSLICQILSTPEDNLWDYTATQHQNMKRAFDFMFPYMLDKSTWPYAPDIAYFDKLPVRGSALLFGAFAYNNKEYINLWKSLKADPEIQEIIRIFVIRQPVLWM